VIDRGVSIHHKNESKIAVIGSGYVGLTLAACMALLGHDVECTDASAERVAGLLAGNVPIVEEGLTELVNEMLASERLHFSHDNAAAVAAAEFVFLCLPTPEGADGHADLTAVRHVAAEIGPHLASGAVVINKSTVPVGTAETVRRLIGRDDVEVVSNPEFLAEGTALQDSLHPDRIVIGARAPEVAARVAALYGGPLRHKFVFADVASAELIKYASNAYLATRLTFVNSIATLCEAAGADIRSVVEGMGADRRIGSAFLRPGPGWGGSCFPKDTQALVRTAESLGLDLAIVRTAIESNHEHIKRIVDKVAAAAGGTLSSKVVAIWGLTFKAGTNDLRSSPALAIAQALRSRGASVRAFDPTVVGSIDGIRVELSGPAACEGADALLIATEWPQFTEIDLAVVGQMMERRSIVDARNLIDAEQAYAAGFDYIGVGLGHLGRRPAEVGV